jgi:hypothetical protein
MLGEIIRDCFDGRRIGAVMELLQQEHAEDKPKIFPWSTPPLTGEAGGECFDGELRQDMIPEDPCPGSLQGLAAVRAQGERNSIGDVCGAKSACYHALILASSHAGIIRRALFAAPSTLDNSSVHYDVLPTGTRTTPKKVVTRCKRGFDGAGAG